MAARVIVAKKKADCYKASLSFKYLPVAMAHSVFRYTLPLYRLQRFRVNPLKPVVVTLVTASFVRSTLSRAGCMFQTLE